MVKCDNCGGPHNAGESCFYCGVSIRRRIEGTKLSRIRAALQAMREKSEEATFQSVFAKPDVTH